MELIRALRIQPGESAAFVGSGGKTSAIFTIARQASVPVMITTTTHMSAEQTLMGDRRWSPNNRHSLKGALSEVLNGGVHVMVSGTSEGDRIGGLAEDLLADAREFSRENDIILLLEADGSKMLPAKAPGSHEPVIPEWVEHVVVCCGLKAVGAPLDDDHVHRAEIFSRLTGVPQGARLSIEDLANVLLSRQGGLKKIPEKAHRTALLNQADTDALQASAGGISKTLLAEYDTVTISKSIGLDERGYHHLEALSANEKCAGIILAAGKSTRMGTSSNIKQLLDWHGKPFIWHVVQAALNAALNPVIVVTGADGSRIEEALVNLPVTFAANPAWEAGQSTSVRAGLEKLTAGIGSAVFLMADQPQIQPTIIRGLVEKHNQSLPPIVAPMINGMRGNPVLFDRDTFDDLKKLQGDTGGRGIFSKFPIEWLPWSDDRMLMDVDTPQDYEKLIRMDE